MIIASWSTTVIFATTLFLAAPTYCSILPNVPINTSSLGATSDATISAHSDAISNSLTKRAAEFCFRMSDSLVAPGYNGVVFATTTNFYDTASFDTYIRSYYFNSTGAPGFIKTYNCSGFTGSHVRYTAALKAAHAITGLQAGCVNSTTVTPTAPFVKLCRDTCVTAVASIRDTFNDPSICVQKPSSTVISQRNVIVSFSNFCATLPYANPSEGNCLDWTKDMTSADMCGFVNIGLALDYCQGSGQNDPCCARALLSLSSTTSSIATSTATSTASSSPSSTTSPQVSSNNTQQISNFLLINMTTIIIVGSLVIILAMVIVIVLVIRRRRKRERRIRTQSYRTGIIAAQKPQVSFKQPPSGAGTQANNTQSNMETHKTQASHPFGSTQMPKSIFPPVVPVVSANSIRTPENGLQSNARSETRSTYSMRSNKRSSSFYPTKNVDGHQQDVAAASNDFDSPGPMTADGVRVASDYILRVCTSYTPNFEDELEISIGQTIVVETIFEDGWAKGRCIQTGRIGIFPVEFTILENRSDTI